MWIEIESSLKERMDKAIESFKKDLSSVNVGKAEPALLERMDVDSSYGGKMKLSNLASVKIQGGSTLMVDVWDKDNIDAVFNVIRNSNLGVNPVAQGKVIKVIFPPLSQERRENLSKIIADIEENFKISLRNIRREFIDKIRKYKKDSTISEDDEKLFCNKVQEKTDKYVQDITSVAKNKKNSILNM